MSKASISKTVGDMTVTMSLEVEGAPEHELLDTLLEYQNLAVKPVEEVQPQDFGGMPQRKQ